MRQECLTGKGNVIVGFKSTAVSLWQITVAINSAKVHRHIG